MMRRPTQLTLNISNSLERLVEQRHQIQHHMAIMGLERLAVAVQRGHDLPCSAPPPHTC